MGKKRNIKIKGFNTSDVNYGYMCSFGLYMSGEQQLPNFTVINEAVIFARFIECADHDPLCSLPASFPVYPLCNGHVLPRILFQRSGDDLPSPERMITVDPLVIKRRFNEFRNECERYLSKGLLEKISWDFDKKQCVGWLTINA